MQSHQLDKIDLSIVSSSWFYLFKRKRFLLFFLPKAVSAGRNIQNGYISKVFSWKIIVSMKLMLHNLKRICFSSLIACNKTKSKISVMKYAWILLFYPVVVVGDKKCQRYFHKWKQLTNIITNTGMPGFEIFLLKTANVWLFVYRLVWPGLIKIKSFTWILISIGIFIFILQRHLFKPLSWFI